MAQGEVCSKSMPQPGSSCWVLLRLLRFALLSTAGKAGHAGGEFWGVSGWSRKPQALVDCGSK